MSSGLDKCREQEEQEHQELIRQTRIDTWERLITELNDMDVMSDEFEDLLFMRLNKKTICNNKRLIELLGQ